MISAISVNDVIAFCLIDFDISKYLFVFEFNL